MRIALVVFGIAAAFFEWTYFQNRHGEWDKVLQAEEPAGRIPSRVILGEIQRGIGILDSFSSAGVPEPALGEIMDALKAHPEFNFRNRRPGEVFAARVDEEGRLVRFSFALDKLRTLVIEKNAEGVITPRLDELQTEKSTYILDGTIQDTFYGSILSRGELPKLASILIGVFEYDIDFVQDVRNGDRYRIYLERITHKGNVVDYGKVIAAEYTGEVAGRVRGYWFDHSNKDIEGFYNEKGLKLKKFFLRAPLDVLRVTSRFGMRFHPVLHRSRMHSGIDYGAPMGTPVWSVADGTVVQAGRAGGYGNLIAVQHGPGLVSKYGHLSKILVRKGQRVSQRQSIGRVGSTGMSTGPHLHFELVQNGRPVNPKNLKVDTPKSLPADLMPRFKEIMAEINQKLENVPVSETGATVVASE